MIAKLRKIQVAEKCTPNDNVVGLTAFTVLDREVGCRLTRPKETNETTGSLILAVAGAVSGSSDHWRACLFQMLTVCFLLELGGFCRCCICSFMFGLGVGNQQKLAPTFFMYFSGEIQRQVVSWLRIVVFFLGPFLQSYFETISTPPP